MDTRERLAEYAHDAWSSYMAYFLKRLDQDNDGNLVIPKAYARNLHSLIATSYSELPEDDRQGDREEADKMLVIITTGDTDTAN